MKAWARERWASSGPRARAVIVLALTLIAAGFLVRPIALRVDPRIVVAVAVIHPGSGGANVTGGRIHGRYEALDPWGHRIVGSGLYTPGAKDPFGAMTYYSVGPDGVDQDGQGDDVVPTAREMWFGRRVAGQPGGLLSLGLLLLWCTLSRWARAQRSGRTGVELGRAVVLASWPSLLSIGAVSTLLGPDLTEWVDALEGHVPTRVPLLFALLGTNALFCFGIAFAWRMSRPLEGAPAAERA